MDYLSISAVVCRLFNDTEQFDTEAYTDTPLLPWHRTPTHDVVGLGPLLSLTHTRSVGWPPKLCSVSPALVAVTDRRWSRCGRKDYQREEAVGYTRQTFRSTTSAPSSSSAD